MYKLYGHIGSPYSMKMRALLRYRQLPFQFMGTFDHWKVAFPNVKVQVMPVLEYPDGTFHNDSTPLIYDLEGRHDDRSVIPASESDAFLALLIEDMADEWLTKSMYAYRWAYPEHTQWTGRLIAYDQLFGAGLSLDTVEQRGAQFAERQVGRNALVGCSAANMPLIEHIGNRAMDIMEAHVTAQPFLFGSRPSIADFGIYGQMSQFIIDLAALEPCQQRAPFTMRWLRHMDDLSGSDGEWRSANEPLAPAIEALLAMAGEEYLPFLLANEAALEAGADTVKLSIDGLVLEQAPFKYQLKCLHKLRESYTALATSSREAIAPLLEKHGCLAPLASDGQAA